MELSMTLKQLRLKKGMRQKEMAAVLNLSTGTISNYENGVHCPDYDTLCVIADYFDVSTDYLLGRTDYPHSDRVLKQHISKKYTVKDLLKFLQRLPAPYRHFFAASIMGLEQLLDATPVSKK